MTLKRDVKFKGKQIRDVKNYVKNWVNFHGNSHKSENFHFAGLVLSKACKDLDEKLQKSYIMTRKGDVRF